MFQMDIRARKRECKQYKWCISLITVAQDNNRLTGMYNAILFIISLIMVGLLLFGLLQHESSEWCANELFFLSLIAFAGLLLVVRSIVERKTSFKRLDVAVAVWFIYSIVHAWMISQHTSNQTLISTTILFLLYISFRTTICCKEEFKPFLLILLLAYGIIENFLGLGQLFSHFHGNEVPLRITGTSFNQGPYSFSVMVVLVVAVAWAYQHKFLKKGSWRNNQLMQRFVLHLCMIDVVTGFLILPSTWSRSAFLGCCIAFATLFWTEHRRKVIWALAIMLGLFVGLYFLKRGSANGRILIQIVSLKAWALRPFFGYGLGSFVPVFGEGMSAYFSKHPASVFLYSADVPSFAFNEFLRVAVEQGTIGLTLMLVVVLSALAILFKKKDELVFGWLAVLVFAFFSYPFSVLTLRVLCCIFVAWAANFSKDSLFINNVYLKSIIKVFLGITMICSSFHFRPLVSDFVLQHSELDRLYRIDTDVFPYDYAEMYKVLKDDVHYLFIYGKALRSEGRYNDSNAVLQRGCQLSCDPMLWVVRGNNYKDLCAYDLSEKMYQQAFAILPNRMYPLYQLFILYRDIGNVSAAHEMAIRLSHFRPKVESPFTNEMRKDADLYLKEFQHYDKE